MRVSRGLLDKTDQPLVKRIVASTFRNITAELQRRSPDTVQQLHRMMFTQRQKNKTLAVLKLVSDKRLRNIGLDVAEAIRDSKAVPERVADVREVVRSVRDVQDFVENTLAQTALVELERDEALMLPAELRHFLGMAHQWSRTLDLENLEMMKSVDSQWRSIEAGWRERPVRATSSLEGLRRAIRAGALEMVRVLLFIIELASYTRMPAWIWWDNTGGEDEPQDGLSCKLDRANAALNLVLCPLRFGGQGLDALRARSHIANRRPEKDDRKATVTPSMVPAKRL